MERCTIIYYYDTNSITKSILKLIMFMEKKLQVAIFGYFDYIMSQNNQHKIVDSMCMELIDHLS